MNRNPNKLVERAKKNHWLREPFSQFKLSIGKAATRNMQIDNQSNIFIKNDDWWSTWRSIQIMNHDRTQWNVHRNRERERAKNNDRNETTNKNGRTQIVNVSWLQERFGRIVICVFLFRACACFFYFFFVGFSSSFFYKFSVCLSIWLILICDRNAFVFAMSQHSEAFTLWPTMFQTSHRMNTREKKTRLHINCMYLEKFIGIERANKIYGKMKMNANKSTSTSSN